MYDSNSLLGNCAVFVHFRAWGRCWPVLNESGHFEDLYTVIACMGLCHNPSRELNLFTNQV